MEERKDIFDKIMMLPGLRILNPFYKKNKEVLLYLFFGGLTFLVSVISYAYFNVTLGINELVANIISWVLAVAFAFFTNRIWVQAPTETVSQFLMQLIRFFMGRVATLVVEEVILLVFITILGFNSMAVKVIAQVIVIVLNYVISKLVVFRKKNDQI